VSTESINSIHIILYSSTTYYRHLGTPTTNQAIVPVLIRISCMPWAGSFEAPPNKCQSASRHRRTTCPYPCLAHRPRYTAKHLPRHLVLDPLERGMLQLLLYHRRPLLLAPRLRLEASCQPHACYRDGIQPETQAVLRLIS
jgi:hypothetical protein